MKGRLELFILLATFCLVANGCHPTPPSPTLSKGMDLNLNMSNMQQKLKVNRRIRI